MFNIVVLRVVRSNGCTSLILKAYFISVTVLKTVLKLTYFKIMTRQDMITLQQMYPFRS